MLPCKIFAELRRTSFEQRNTRSSQWCSWCLLFSLKPGSRLSQTRLQKIVGNRLRSSPTKCFLSALIVVPQPPVLLPVTRKKSKTSSWYYQEMVAVSHRCCSHMDFLPTIIAAEKKLGPRKTQMFSFSRKSSSHKSQALLGHDCRWSLASLAYKN